VTLSAGAHTLLDSKLVPLRGWYPIEFLHFPIRSFEQCDRKYENLRASLGASRNAYYEEVHRAREAGRFAEFYESIVIDDAALERGLQDGSLVIDTRLRDALRSLRSQDGSREFALPGKEGRRLLFDRPSVVDDAAYAVDVAALGEADVVRLQRQVDTLEQRLQTIENTGKSGLSAKIAARARQLLRR
jgi:hypothetical protein